MAWTKVSAEEAAQAPYYGFGGWLLAFYIVLVLYLLFWMPFYFLQAPASWDPLLFNTVHATRILFWLPFLVLCPLKHPMMPAITITLMWFSLAMTWTVGFFGSSSHPITWIPSMFIGATFAALMTWYFRSSQRVNATYRHRVWT